MSDDGRPINPDGSPPARHPLPPPQRNGCATVLMVVVGIILLLPGLCSLFFVFAGIANTSNTADLQLVGGCLFVACFGVALIWWAIRRPRS